MPTDPELLETDQVMYAPTSFQKAVDVYQLQKADISNNAVHILTSEAESFKTSC